MFHAILWPLERRARISRTILPISKWSPIMMSRYSTDKKRRALPAGAAIPDPLAGRLFQFASSWATSLGAASAKSAQGAASITASDAELIGELDPVRRFSAHEFLGELQPVDGLQLAPLR